MKKTFIQVFGLTGIVSLLSYTVQWRFRRLLTPVTTGLVRR